MCCRVKSTGNNVISIVFNVIVDVIRDSAAEDGGYSGALDVKGTFADAAEAGCGAGGETAGGAGYGQDLAWLEPGVLLPDTGNESGANSLAQLQDFLLAAVPIRFLFVRLSYKFSQDILHLFVQPWCTSVAVVSIYQGVCHGEHLPQGLEMGFLWSVVLHFFMEAIVLFFKLRSAGFCAFYAECQHSSQ